MQGNIHTQTIFQGEENPNKQKFPKKPCTFGGEEAMRHEFTERYLYEVL